MFKDRAEAGHKLGRALEAYRDSDAIVLAIPRGGVEVAYYVAEYLSARLSMVIVRKLPLPMNPETGFGAIAEDGSVFLVESAVGVVLPDVAVRIQKEQEQEIARRVEVLRQGEPLPAIEGRTVILVDDGIAMGSTMRAGVMLCRNKKAKKVVAASPVAGPSAATSLSKVVDEIVILERPMFFRAVAQAYTNWYDVPDAEVIEIMHKSIESQLQSHAGG
ncbi:MAG: phosphoribosyltransferase [Planctomycetota bacterium]|jgi:predicted phosphoribosyltransferase